MRECHLRFSPRKTHLDVRARIVSEQLEPFLLPNGERLENKNFDGRKTPHTELVSWCWWVRVAVCVG